MSHATAEIPCLMSFTMQVKPDIVFFGEGLPERFFSLAESDFDSCDLLLVMGTSLVVQPFAGLIGASPKQLLHSYCVWAGLTHATALANLRELPQACTNGAAAGQCRP